MRCVALIEASVFALSSVLYATPVLVILEHRVALSAEGKRSHLLCESTWKGAIEAALNAVHA